MTVDDDRPTDLADLCDGCEVKTQWQFFEGSANEELARRFDEGSCVWTFAALYSDVVRVMNLAAKTLRGAYPRECDLLTARSLDIWRAEEYRPIRVARFELAQKEQKA